MLNRERFVLLADGSEITNQSRKNNKHYRATFVALFSYQLPADSVLEKYIYFVPCDI